MSIQITFKKNRAVFLPIILLVFVVVSCNNNKNGVEAPVGMNTINLSAHGKPFSIFVPDTTKARLIITEQTNGALEIRSGTAFAIAINEQAADLQQIKSDISGDDVNKLKTLMVDEPSNLMWESSVVQPEFHFYVNKKFGNSEYSFEDIRSTESDPFTKDAVQRMFEASKNVQATEK